MADKGGLEPAEVGGEELRCDVLVVGGGPAGIAAASRAAEEGAEVVLVDQGNRLGGQIWRHRLESDLPRRARGWLRRIRESGAVVRFRTTVISAGPSLVVTAEVEDGGALRVKARQAVILATGASERFLPFPGWTLPGVMGVGGLQAMQKSGWGVEGARIVLAGTGPLLLAVGSALRRGGAKVMFVAEQAPMQRLLRIVPSVLRAPRKCAEGIRYRWDLRSSAYSPGWWVTRAEGEAQVERTVLTNGKKEATFQCDLLGIGYGLEPALELPALWGCALGDLGVSVDRFQRTSVDGILAVGEPTGVAGVDAALAEGEVAGFAATGDPERTPAGLLRQTEAGRRFASKLDAVFRLRGELRKLATDETILCRCEDVRVGEIRSAVSAREAKIASRAGMGSCQGRVCGPALRFILGSARDSVRPPIVPGRIETLAAKWQREEPT